MAVLASVGRSALSSRLGQRHVGLLEQRLEDLVARLRALLDRVDPAEALAQVGAQLVEGVELAGLRGEAVVERRQVLLLDRDDRRR